MCYCSICSTQYTQDLFENPAVTKHLRLKFLPVPSGLFVSAQWSLCKRTLCVYALWHTSRFDTSTHLPIQLPPISFKVGCFGARIEIPCFDTTSLQQDHHFDWYGACKVLDVWTTVWSSKIIQVMLYLTFCTKVWRWSRVSAVWIQMPGRRIRLDAKATLLCAGTVCSNWRAR